MIVVVVNHLCLDAIRVSDLRRIALCSGIFINFASEMDFRTEYIPRPSALRLHPERPALLLGSCFSDNVGTLMRRSLWAATVNPCGTLFNPVSIANAVGMACGSRPVGMPWCGDDGVWRSWDFPASFADLSEEGCAAKCREAVGSLRASLERAEVLLVSFGTSVVYSLASSPDAAVANCHKRPAALFVRRRLGVDEIVKLWESAVEQARTLNSSLKVVFTVSPVRHVKEGFEENSLSKATLLLACERLCRTLADCVYFPAFEILADDLRDYRFYASDLVHPSADASEYVFGKFCAMFLGEDGIRLLKEGRRLAARAAHRPLVAGSPGAEKFAEETRRLSEAWHVSHPLMLIPSDI